MADEDGMFPDEETAGTGPTETPQFTLEEQPTSVIPPANTAAGPEETTDPGSMALPVNQIDQQAEYVYQATQTMQGLAPQPDAQESGQTEPGYPPNVSYMPNYAQPGYPQAMYQQPSAPLPFQPGQPALYTPPRKRRTALWTILTVIVLLLLGGGTTLAIAASQRPTNTPTQALQQFCDGYKTLNAQKIYDTLSKSSQAKTSVAEIQRDLNAIKSFGSIVKITDCKISNVRENGSTATATMTIVNTASFGSISTSVSVPVLVRLVLENNTWKIDTSKTNSQVTFPPPPTQPNFLTPTVSGS